MAPRNHFDGDATAQPFVKRTGEVTYSLQLDADPPVRAAFVVPVIFQDGYLWVLLQEEDERDERDEYGAHFTPKLGMFGGKVGAHDRHPVQTAVRECKEETGVRCDGSTLLSRDALQDIQVGFRNEMQKRSPHGALTFTSYLPDAKAQVYFYVVPAAFATPTRDWRALPYHYWHEFKGQTDKSKERYATRMHWVRVKSSPGVHAAEALDVTSAPHVRAHECVPGCAARCGRQSGVCPVAGKPLGMKRVLVMAMEKLLSRREKLTEAYFINELSWRLEELGVEGDLCRKVLGCLLRGWMGSKLQEHGASGLEKLMLKKNESRFQSEVANVRQALGAQSLVEPTTGRKRRLEDTCIPNAEMWGSRAEAEAAKVAARSA